MLTGIYFAGYFYILHQTENLNVTDRVQLPKQNELFCNYMLNHQNRQSLYVVSKMTIFKSCLSLFLEMFICMGRGRDVR